MNIVTRLWVSVFALVGIAAAVMVFLLPQSEARNVMQYSDTISDSGPNEYANHTFEFILNTSVGGGASFEITPPAGFDVISTTTFDIRNVEMKVNGVSRAAAAVASPGVDQVEITTGSPGFFRYTLAPDGSIAAGSAVEIKIGNHTSTAIGPYVSFSSTTGTTTYSGDVEPIRNSSDLGIHRVQLDVFDGGLVADAQFVIFLNQKVSVPGVDTTEEVPPFRFNPAPTSTVGGTTLSVEISLETDELAICRYSTVAGTAFGSMTNTFSNTGLIFHSTVVNVTPNSFQQFFVRCIDDEGNFNIDDFVIEFRVDEAPTGQANTEGSTSGNGTGTGNSGTGTGSGGGGTSGGSSGEAPTTGGSAGSGGSGGGGGGGRGGNTGSTAGGGFETDDAPYRSGDARVIISGFAFPNSNVAVLVDGKVAQVTRANSNASYSVTLDAISRGVYTFGVYAEGSDRIRSATFSTSFTVTGGRTSELTNINVSPSIQVTPDPVTPGQTLTVSGSALPNSTVTIQNGKAKSRNMSESTTEADGSGRWTLTLNTSNFSRGTYQIRAKSAQTNGATTNYSAYTFYGVGEAAQTGSINADLNRDGRVNLTDFSILLFWWNTNGGDSEPPADINRDGRVNLTDFSILLFNWTG
jgi:Dockerin type I domain